MRGCRERVEQVTDELGMREIVYGERQLVAVGGCDPGVGRHHPGVSDQRVQGLYSAGSEKVSRRGGRGPDVGQPGQVAGDLAGCRSGGEGRGSGLRQCLAGPSHQEQVGAVGCRAARHLKRQGPAHPPVGPVISTVPESMTVIVILFQPALRPAMGVGRGRLAPGFNSNPSAASGGRLSPPRASGTKQSPPPWPPACRSQPANGLPVSFPAAGRGRGSSRGALRAG
jgi:hypothetical protein